MKSLEALKEDLCEVGRRLYQRGFIAAMEGNLSVRASDHELLATPTGVCKGYLTPDMIVSCDLSGKQLSGDLRISTEIRMHLSVYEVRPEINAIVHAHPPKSTGFAVAEVVVTLGCIPLAEYGTPSTPDLAKSVERLVRVSDGILLSNHGAMTVGSDLFDAFYKMEIIEHFAEISLISRILGGERLLPREEVSRLLSLRKKVYGITGPAGGAECPIPAETASAKGSETIELTREELTALISDAIREVGGTTGS